MPDRLTRLGILVGVDGSACSRVALRWAADEAVMRNVPLTLVHVLNTPEGSWSSWGLSTSPFPADFDQKRKEKALQVMDDAVKAIKDGAEQNGALTINTELLFSPVVPTLIDLGLLAAFTAGFRPGQTERGAESVSSAWQDRSPTRRSMIVR